MEYKHLEGSPAKDAFNCWHKHYLKRNYYAADLDLVLLRREPHTVIAAMEFKCKNTEKKSKTLGLKYTHVNLFNWVIENGVSVYIVWARWNQKNKDKADFSDFDIYQYLGGDPGPPDTPIEYRVVREGVDKDTFSDWEKYVRDRDQFSHTPKLTIFDFYKEYLRIIESYNVRVHKAILATLSGINSDTDKILNDVVNLKKRISSDIFDELSK